MDDKQQASEAALGTSQKGQIRIEPCDTARACEDMRAHGEIGRHEFTVFT